MKESLDLIRQWKSLPQNHALDSRDDHSEFMFICEAYLVYNENHCAFVLGEWSQDYAMVLYPFSRNNLTARTHDGYIKAAQEAQKRSNGKKDVSVQGVKGFSSLFQV